MADQKISNLTELTVPAPTDELEIVDKSDTANNATGENKRITVATMQGTALRSVIAWRHTQITTAVAAGSYLLYPTASPAIISSNATAGMAPVYLNPADYAVAGLTTKYLVRAVCLTNATAPGITFTVRLALVSSTAGGNDLNTISLGATQTSVVFTTPAASTPSQDVSAEITAPAAGFLALYVVTSGTNATNNRTSVGATVLCRNVV